MTTFNKYINDDRSIEESILLIEGGMSDIYELAEESDDEDSFIKKFFKEFGDKVKKNADSIKWAKSIYKDSIAMTLESNETVNEYSTQYVQKMLKGKSEKEGYEIYDFAIDNDNPNLAKEILKYLRKTYESVVIEGRNITTKRKYTENHPASTVGKSARIRNKMLEAIKDGKISQLEFDAILKEMSSDSKRWMKRNSSMFNVSEDGISLSGFGNRILRGITINEKTMKNPETWVPGGFDKDISKYKNKDITREIVLKTANKWKVSEKDAIEYVEFAWTLDLDEAVTFVHESFGSFLNANI